jgi:hypothetical protein
MGKAQSRVFEALKHLRGRFPFPLLGLDSDNGSEFINSHLVQYCRDEELTFTRSRPYPAKAGYLLRGAKELVYRAPPGRIRPVFD